MTNLSLNSTNYGNMSSNVADVEVDSKSTDGATGQEETEYVITKGEQYFGYFNEIAELKSAILLKAVWNVGKGYKVEDAETKIILEQIKGWGKDTFDDILFNLEVTKRIYGDAFAEIIRDDKGLLINLKVLDPVTIKIVVDSKGIIKRYVQMSKNPKAKKEVNFKPEEILHLSNNRLADQIHGISDIESLEKTILAENESFTDIRKIMHRQARPFIVWKLGTDDPSKISQFIAKMDEACNKGENVYIPQDDNAVSFEIVQVNPSQILMAWRDDVRNKFYRSIGLPQLIPSGASQTTESGGKIGYLAFEQIVEKDQRQIEKALWNQLQIKINLIPPATLSTSLSQDNQKDGQAFQPNDTQAGVGQ